MTEEQQRIRSYLVAQGAKLTPAAMVDKVRAAMVELEAASRAVPVDRFGERPEPEEWSGNEVMSHVVAAGAYFGGGIVAALDDAPPPPRMGGSGAENAPARPAAEWCRLLWREALLFLRLHDLDHAGQLQKIAAALTAFRPT